LERNDSRPYRVVLVESDGTILPKTGWCVTDNHVQRVAGEWEQKGYRLETLHAMEAVGDQIALFEIEERSHMDTAGGYEFGEVASALQKEIRRGNESEAMFWAFELEKDYYKYVWKRLCVIASEDVGLADPMAAVLVGSLRDTYMFIRENSRKGVSVDFNILCHAVLYLCRASKNREVDEFGNFVQRDVKDLQIPDYALDMHTKRGRMMGRGSRYFWEEGAKVSPEVGGSAYSENIERWIAEDESKR